MAAAVLIAWGAAGCGRGGGTDGGASTTFVTIGTGAMTGVYYPTGNAIATLVNARAATYRIRASVESTGGSVYNINAVVAGDLEFGIAQSDRNHQAWTGTADWNGSPQTSLRSVLSLHPEVVTLVAAEDTGIRSLADLKGRRVNLGNPGSGHRGNAELILRAAGMDPDRDLLAESLQASEAPKMLQDGRLDAFFYTVGHPNGAIQEATTGRRTVRFVPIPGNESLLAEHPYYAEAVIPGGLYPLAAGGGEDVSSIGVVTTLITSSDVPDDVVYAVTKEIVENLEQFRGLHPALAVLTRAGMRKGLSAPLHPGAQRYFDESEATAP
jgi:hypothetical protein